MSETTPIEVKRLWLRAEATNDDLERAQIDGVKECYYGNSIALGAAILGTAWYPGSGLACAEDEHYAESMTYYKNAFEAICDVMRECMKAVAEMCWAAEYYSGNRDVAGETWQRARAAEMEWQRQHVFTSMVQREKLVSLGAMQQGSNRQENQDAFMALPELGLFLVVDALGHARAAAITCAIFEATVHAARGEGTLEGVLTRAARQTNVAILEAVKTDVSLQGMGAQFVALLVDENRVRVAWMGQCRCYRSRALETKLLTKDDPTLGCSGPYDMGNSDEPFVPLVHYVLGGDPEIRVHEIEIESPLGGDTYLLSTDGLHGLYEDQVHVQFDNAWNESLPRLISSLMTNATMPDDDVTALCIRLGSS